MREVYVEGEKVIQPDSRFKHVMAVTLNPKTNYKNGVIRCITSRSGWLTVKGNVDRSVLHKINRDSLEHFKIGERLKIKNEEEVISKLVGENGDLLGLEDPDIWIDWEKNLIHLYFTMPIIHTDKNHKKIGKTKVHLGHAEGKDLDSLVMTQPVLVGSYENSAKEVSIAPLNSKGFRYNLIESRDRRTSTTYSIVKVAIANSMSGPWEYGETAFHPADYNYHWIAGHASPGPLFPKNFIDIGENKLAGIINGCEANQKIGKDVKYGDFAIGLFIYDYENGKILWVSESSFIQDSEAGKDGGRAITFASQFVETEKGEGILYAHIDDSFVRSYILNAEGIKNLLPTNF